MMNTSAANGHLFTNYPSLFDYSTAPALEPFANLLDKVRVFFSDFCSVKSPFVLLNQGALRDDREMRGSNNGNSSGTSTSTLGSTTTEVHRNNGSLSAGGNLASVAVASSASAAAAAAAAVTSSQSSSSSAAAAAAAANRGEEEWKNIHTMLNCISAMVDKTKRAITILQQRGVETTSNLQANAAQHTDTSIADMKRQTEEKVAEFRRNAEEAVNQVKRQAVIEIQRAVAAAESRAIEAMAQERLKLEKMFAGRY